jgi:hypothetical protein
MQGRGPGGKGTKGRAKSHGPLFCPQAPNDWADSCVTALPGVLALLWVLTVLVWVCLLWLVMGKHSFLALPCLGLISYHVHKGQIR